MTDQRYTVLDRKIGPANWDSESTTMQIATDWTYVHDDVTGSQDVEVHVVYHTTQPKVAFKHELDHQIGPKEIAAGHFDPVFNHMMTFREECLKTGKDEDEFGVVIMGMDVYEITPGVFTTDVDATDMVNPDDPESEMPVSFAVLERTRTEQEIHWNPDTDSVVFPYLFTYQDDDGISTQECLLQCRYRPDWGWTEANALFNEQANNYTECMVQRGLYDISFKLCLKDRKADPDTHGPFILGVEFPMSFEECKDQLKSMEKRFHGSEAESEDELDE